MTLLQSKRTLPGDSSTTLRVTFFAVLPRCLWSAHLYCVCHYIYANVSMPFCIRTLVHPDFAHKAAQAVADGVCERGIVVCTTGIGVSITANKHKGVRCALCTNVDQAKFTRLHNDANMIAFGARYTTDYMAKQMLDTFLSTEFEGGRHQRRVDKIEL